MFMGDLCMQKFAKAIFFARFFLGFTESDVEEMKKTIDSIEWSLFVDFIH
jgi:hypothetical protein